MIGGDSPSNRRKSSHTRGAVGALQPAPSPTSSADDDEAIAAIEPVDIPQQPENAVENVEPDPIEDEKREPNPLVEKDAHEPTAAREDALPSVPERAEPPSGEERKRAELRVAEVFGAEIKGAKSVARRLELSKKLLQVGRETQGEPATRFVLIETSATLAAETADVQSISEAVDQLVSEYDAVDRVATMEPLLRRATKFALRTRSHRKDVANASIDLATVSILSDRLKAAADLLDLATVESKPLNDARLKSRIENVAERIEYLRIREREFALARERLAATPDDPEANSVAGCCLLFGKRRRIGLDHFRKCGSPSFRRLAELEHSVLKTASETYELAEGWRSLAESSSLCERRAMLELALFAYQSCVSDVTGINRENAVKQIERLAKEGIESAVVNMPQWDRFVQDGMTAGDLMTISLSGDVSLTMVWCPPGRFTMGDDRSGEANEKPAHAVDLDGFWLGQTEVTQGQWKAVMDTAPWQGQTLVKEGEDFPAAQISHDDATAFCKRLTERERNAGRLPADAQYALPTEPQWEYACRAGTTTTYSFGEDAANLGEHAWWGGVFGDGNCKGEQYPHETGSKKPNRWGLYDVHGNVWEWTADRYFGSFSEASRAKSTSPLPDETSYVIRGGCWHDAPDRVRSAARHGIAPFDRPYYLGFRLSASAPKGKTGGARPSSDVSPGKRDVVE